MSNIIQNAVFIRSQDKYYVSFRRHDFIAFKTKDNIEYFIDGGSVLSDGGYYFRSNFSIQNPPDDIIPWFLSENSPFSEIKDKLLWGTRGPDGKQPLKYQLFKDLTIEHLKAILDYSDKFYIKLSDIHIKAIKYWIDVKKFEK